MTDTPKKSKTKYGLNDAEVELSRAEHGGNQMTSAKRKGFWAHFISNLNDPIIKVLIGALFINIIFIFKTSD